jgi:hypothetical protein
LRLPRNSQFQPIKPYRILALFQNFNTLEQLKHH